MALIKCPKCGNLISDKAETCPKCGSLLSDALQQSMYDKEAEEKDRIFSLVEEQKKTISQLEIDIANGRKKVLSNRYKFLLGVVLFLTLLTIGYYWTHNLFMPKYDSSMDVLKDSTFLHSNDIPYAYREYNLESEAKSNFEYYFKAIATTGVVLDFTHNNDSMRLFIKANGFNYSPRIGELLGVEKATYAAYFYTLNKKQQFYKCRFVGCVDKGNYAHFLIFDTNNNFSGDLVVFIHLLEEVGYKSYLDFANTDTLMKVEGPHISISKRIDEFEWIETKRILYCK